MAEQDENENDLKTYPLGKPVRPEEEPKPEWVPVDPAKPWLQRSTVTGRWRNVKQTPLA